MAHLTAIRRRHIRRWHGHMEFQAEQVTSHSLSGLTNRSIQLVGDPVVRSLDRKRFLYTPMMLMGVRMKPFPVRIILRQTLPSIEPSSTPLRMSLGVFRNQLPRRFNYVWTTCRSALGLLDGLIRPRWVVCTNEVGSITRNSRDIAQRNSVQETCCYGRVVGFLC